mmetsp:Transcript_2668/g.4432  ORF Transcript_2668/g.4432 Transcript_2668/m.4432 type:complete len:89 (+) Transcript_2668:82-348(+)
MEEKLNGTTMVHHTQQLLLFLKRTEEEWRHHLPEEQKKSGGIMILVIKLRALPAHSAGIILPQLPPVSLRPPLLARPQQQICCHIRCI